ncbi:hypothetical protein GCM10008932_22890 [Alkalibacterium iburiense]|uniref:Uncharacterized protein n=1 Tax=Alkalibacterium iburiense TaxID=290589 RepID=A0ABP3HHF6_9LACT
MLEKINKIPAGTFLVPLVLSMVVYTIWPNLFIVFRQKTPTSKQSVGGR